MCVGVCYSVRKWANAGDAACGGVCTQSQTHTRKWRGDSRRLRRPVGRWIGAERLNLNHQSNSNPSSPLPIECLQLGIERCTLSIRSFFLFATPIALHRVTEMQNCVCRYTHTRTHARVISINNDFGLMIHGTARMRNICRSIRLCANGGSMCAG